MKKKPLLLIFPFLIFGTLIVFTTSCGKTSSTDNSSTHIDTIHEDTLNLVIPAGWSKVGGLKANNMIWSITSDASGKIYAAGYFTNSSGYNYVARFNGTVWEDIGLKANAAIYALATDSHGNVYAEGMFTNGATPSGGNAYVAKWNGTIWSDIGPSHSRLVLTTDAVGNVYSGPAKWDGSTWRTFTNMNIGDYSVSALATTASGDQQYAGGTFTYPSGYRYVAKWEGSVWTEVGSLNANADINALAVDNSGNVYAAGEFSNGNLPTTGYKYVAKFDGTTWSELGHLNANQTISYLAVDDIHGYVVPSNFATY